MEKVVKEVGLIGEGCRIWMEEGQALMDTCIHRVAKEEGTRRTSGWVHPSPPFLPPLGLFLLGWSPTHLLSALSPPCLLGLTISHPTCSFSITLLTCSSMLSLSPTFPSPPCRILTSKRLYSTVVWPLLQHCSENAPSRSSIYLPLCSSLLQWQASPSQIFSSLGYTALSWFSGIYLSSYCFPPRTPLPTLSLGAPSVAWFLFPLLTTIIDSVEKIIRMSYGQPVFMSVKEA